jgi:hypothetical protein
VNPPFVQDRQNLGGASRTGILWLGPRLHAANLRQKVIYVQVNSLSAENHATPLEKLRITTPFTCLGNELTGIGGWFAQLYCIGARCRLSCSVAEKI